MRVRTSNKLLAASLVITAGMWITSYAWPFGFTAEYGAFGFAVAVGRGAVYGVQFDNPGIRYAPPQMMGYLVPDQSPPPFISSDPSTTPPVPLLQAVTNSPESHRMAMRRLSGVML